MSRKVDITGKRFGRLTVVRKTDQRKGGFVVWECLCDCGNTIMANTGILSQGNKRSCGCLRDVRDMTGQRFGRLVVLRKTDKVRHGLHYWLCACDCGNETIVRSNALTLGVTQSCGCLSRDTAKEKIKRINERHQREGTDLSLITEKMIKSNTSGVKGVHWFAPKALWCANIQFKEMTIHLGYFSKLEDAAKVRKEAEEKYFTPVLEKYGRLENEK